MARGSVALLPMPPFLACLLFVKFEIGSHSIAKAELELMILLPSPFPLDLQEADYSPDAISKDKGGSMKTTIL